MTENMMDHMASLLQNRLPHSIVGCMRVHKSEDNFVRIGYKEWLVEISAGKACETLLGIREYNIESHTRAYRCVHTVGRRSQGFLVFLTFS